jgi:hypothetical protein
MEDLSNRACLLMSLQRALLGEVHAQLRQASIEVDAKLQLVRLRFEYDGPPKSVVQKSCSCAAAEVIADFPSPWQLEEQHDAVPFPNALRSLEHVAYLRAEVGCAT